MNETILICVLNWSKIWSTKPAIFFSESTVEHQFTKSTKSSKFRLSTRVNRASEINVKLWFWSSPKIQMLCYEQFDEFIDLI